MNSHHIAELKWVGSETKFVEMSCACGEWSVTFQPAQYSRRLPLDEAKSKFDAHRQKKEMQNE